MFPVPAISIFYLLVKLVIFVKLKKEKIPVYAVLVLTLNPIFILLQNQPYFFIDSLTAFSFLILIYFFSFPRIERLNKILFSIPLIVAILHTERNLLLQVMICEVMLVWMAYSIYEQIVRQYKNSEVIDLTFVNIFVTHLVEILILLMDVEKIASYQQITISLLVISAIFLLVFSLFPKLFITKSTIQWNSTLLKEEDIDKNENLEEEEITSKNLPKQFLDDYELTEREEEVIDLISKGFTSKEISEKMFLSKKTIDHYRAAIKEKLGYRKRSELVEFALSRTDSTSPNIKHTSNTSKIKQKEVISI